MKDRPDRAARLPLIKSMCAGQSWQEAVTQSQLTMSRSTADRLVQLARDQDKAEQAFLADRHGHPYKLTQPVLTWLTEFCTTNPQMASNRVQVELKRHFDVAVSVRQISRARAQLGVSRQRQSPAQVPRKKT